MSNPEPKQLSEPELRALQKMLADVSTADHGFERLGEELGASALGGERWTRGKQVFDRRLAEVRKIVCESEQAKSYCGDSSYADATTIAALVAGSLMAANFAGLNVLLVSCIAARLGIRSFCSAAWDEE